jgi:CheY-like chemotaxis protein
MKLSIQQTLLIDDDKSTNLFNKKIVERHGAFNEVIAVTSGRAALEYFNAVEKNIATKPDLIFLDINMPGMNGWEFLKKLSNLEHELIQGVNIFMLSTSCDEREIEKSKGYKLVKGFLNKPISFKLLDEILKKYFYIIT